MKIIKGSSLVDYVVPTVVVGLVIGLGLYYFVSSGNLLKFFNASTSGYKSGKKIVIDAIGGERPGSLGGTPDNPKMKCGFNTCTIDFGDYILTGIPENVAEISTATRGGIQTANYYYLMQQLANQMEKAGADTDLISYIREIANNAKKMAVVEMQGDKVASQLYKLEKQFIDDKDDPNKNAQAELSKINIDNLNLDNYNTLLGVTRFMSDMEVLNNQGLDNFSKIILSIKQDYKAGEPNNNLKDWQRKFLEDITSGIAGPNPLFVKPRPDNPDGGIFSGIDIDKLRDMAAKIEKSIANNPEIEKYINSSINSSAADDDYINKAKEINLTQLSTGLLGNSNIYQVTVKNSSYVADLAHKEGPIGGRPAAKLNYMLENPQKYKVDPIKNQAILNILKTIGGEVNDIGDKITTQQSIIGKGFRDIPISSEKFSLPPDSNIDTKIAQSLLNKYLASLTQ